MALRSLCSWRQPARCGAYALRAAAAIGLASAFLGGCGWTARDEFIQNRQVQLSPSAGDGSIRIADWQRSTYPTRDPVSATAALPGAR